MASKPTPSRCRLCQKALELKRGSGENSLYMVDGKTVVVHTRCKRLKKLGKIR